MSFLPRARKTLRRDRQLNRDKDGWVESSDIDRYGERKGKLQQEVGEVKIHMHANIHGVLSKISVAHPLTHSHLYVHLHVYVLMHINLLIRI